MRCIVSLPSAASLPVPTSRTCSAAAWRRGCLANVVGKADRRGNLYPTKQRPEQKIDAAVALMMAMGRAMIEDEDAKGLEGFLTNPIFG
jgi:hypothetical protein